MGQNDRFDVRIQELVSKAKNPGGFLRKKRFLGSIFLQFASCFAFFLKRAQDFELLKQVPESSHQTGYFGRNQYIGTLTLS